MRTLALLALALGAWTPATAQESAPPPAAPALAEPEDVSDVAAAALEGTGVPGLAVGLWHLGGVRALGAAGVRARGSDEPVTVDDRWHLGSCTKAMTAALCAVAAQRGLLAFDDPLETLLAGTGIELDPGAATITLAQLLDHTSGLPANDRTLMARTLTDTRTLREYRRDVVAAKVLGRPPETLPGERFEYSNLGYVVAGVVLEEAFDLDWEALLARELFTPLGMTRAGFGAPGTPDAVDEPRGHVGTGRLRRAVPPGPRGDNPAWLGPAGTVHAPLADWLAFLALFVEPTAMRDSSVPTEPLTLASLDRLRTPAAGRDYALGWRVAQRDWAGGTALTHAGSNTMWYAVAWVAPARDLVVVATANAADDAAREACDSAVWTLLQRLDGPTDR